MSPLKRTISARIAIPQMNSWIRDVISAHTRQGVEEKTIYVARLLNESYFGLRRHRSPLRFGQIHGRSRMEQQLFGVGISVLELRSKLGAADGVYRKIMAEFFDFNARNAGYSSRGRQTKCYLLSVAAIARLDACWSDESSAEIVDGWSGGLARRDRLPVNGVVRTSFSKLRVPSLIGFQLEDVNARVSRLEQILGAGGGLLVGRVRAETIALRWLYAVRKWIRCVGGVLNTYADYREDAPKSSGSGRLFGLGQLHLQRLPRSARAHLFAGTGWSDYDFVSCHPTILRSMGRSYELDHPLLDDYVENRLQVAEELAEDLEIPIGKVKRLVNALFYGMSLSTRKTSALAGIVGSFETRRRVCRSLYIVALRAEIRSIRSEAIKRHTTGRTLVNAVGKRLALRERTGESDRATPPKRLLSFVVTGVEAWALNAICEGRTGVLVLSHDGFLSADEVDTVAAERRIKELSEAELGMRLELKLQRKSHYVPATQ